MLCYSSKVHPAKITVHVLCSVVVYGCTNNKHNDDWDDIFLDTHCTYFMTDNPIWEKDNPLIGTIEEG